MSARRDIAYIYDGTFDGLITGVFEAFDRKEHPSRIIDAELAQLSFNEDHFEIYTDYEKSERVCKWVTKNLGAEDFKYIFTLFLSNFEDKGITAYKYIKIGTKYKKETKTLLTNPAVLNTMNAYRAVNREYEKLRGFVRFSRVNESVFYAKIKPKHNQTPLLMNHFSDRFQTMPFIIHDTFRKTVGLYNTKTWEIVSAEDLQAPEYSDDELKYRELWKEFYKSVAIDERINLRLRMNNMPKRYWQYMNEIDLF